MGTEERIIKVLPVISYGVTKYRPVCAISKIFCQLIRAQTLNARDVEHIKALGYRVIVASNSPAEL
jgi:hypothetical protein